MYRQSEKSLDDLLEAERSSKKKEKKLYSWELSSSDDEGDDWAGASDDEDRNGNY